MTPRCENCNSPVLESDSVCWHCGRRLSHIDAEPATPSSSQPEPDAADETETAALGAVARYAGLTVLVIVAALLVMHALSQRPLIVLHPDTRSAAWVAITDPAQRFTLDMPAAWAWRWIETENSVPAPAVWQTAVAPLGTAVPDTELLLFAEGQDTAVPGIFIIVRSARLARLSVPEALEFARTVQAEPLTITTAAAVTNVAGREQAQLMVQHGETGELCQQRFVVTQSAGYLLAACTNAARYSRYELEFDTMLDSFQFLARRYK